MDKYPPLAPLSELSLHGREIHAEDTWACQVDRDHRERWPTKDKVQYDWRCVLCTEHARDRLHWEGDDDHLWRPNQSEETQVVKLSWLVERAKYWGSLW